MLKLATGSCKCRLVKSFAPAGYAQKKRAGADLRRPCVPVSIFVLGASDLNIVEVDFGAGILVRSCR